MIAIRALVVDDERPARDNICALLHGEPNWRVIGECDSASALRAAIASEVPDVVFLDIRLPGADGIALAAELQALTRPPLIVFTTAFETYAVAAFELQAIDYLMKPFDDLRFGAALRRVEHALTTQATPTQFRQRLVIRSIGRVQFVYAAQIDWLEASGTTSRSTPAQHRSSTASGCACSRPSSIRRCSCGFTARPSSIARRLSRSGRSPAGIAS